MPSFPRTHRRFRPNEMVNDCWSYFSPLFLLKTLVIQLSLNKALQEKINLTKQFLSSGESRNRVNWFFMQRLVLIQLANVTASEENYGVIKVYTNCSSGIYNMRLFLWDTAKIVRKVYSFPQINIEHLSS